MSNKFTLPEEEERFIKEIKNKKNKNFFQLLLDYRKVIECNKKIALAAVSRYPGALYLFDYDTIKSDKNIVLAAVTKDGRALKDVSLELKEDLDVVLAAIRQNPINVSFADYDFRTTSEHPEIIAARSLRYNPHECPYDSEENWE